MKLFISENIDRAIEGYIVIPIVYGEFDLQKIPDNSATEIVAIDALDSIKYENVNAFISTITKKMRLGCNLYLGGTDAFIVCKNVINGSRNLKDLNETILSKTGLFSLKMILELLRGLGIKINSAVFKGEKYEISATRSKN